MDHGDPAAGCRRRKGLVVGVLAALVLGQIANPFQLRKLVQQLFFNTFFQGHVDHRAAVASAAELQDSQTVVGDLHQRYAAAVACQLRV